MARGFHAGIGNAAIQAWLIEERGYPAEKATRARIAHHLRNHVPKAA